MPQMAPMMWQMLYLYIFIMLLILISKNFFSNIKIKSSVKKIYLTKNELNWMW